jgi:hypothetical protein
MASVVRKVAATTTVAVLAGFGLTASTSSAGAASFEDTCAGMSAPAHTTPGNLAPTPMNDTGKVVAGGTTAIRVLANDTDPDGNKLYVVSISKPAKGFACIDANGDVEYVSSYSSTDYTQVLTYGVTDGDLYRTATVTVAVEGVKPVRPVLKHRLTYKKHTHTVKHRARVAFTNTNKRSVIVLAGSPRKDRPEFRHYVASGQTLGFSTKSKRVRYVVVMPLPNDDFTLASLGLLNTRNGHQQVISLDDQLRTRPSSARTLANRWLHP